MTDDIEKRLREIEELDDAAWPSSSQFQVPFLIDTIRRLLKEREWQSVEKAPYDTICLFRRKDGNIVQDFIYDCAARDTGYTHFMPLSPPPKGDE